MSDAIIFAPVLSWSGALRRRLFADPSLQGWLRTAYDYPITRHTISAWFDTLCADFKPYGMENGLKPSYPNDVIRKVLRQLRERVFFTLMLRDLNQLASLPEVMTAMSALADLCVNQAYRSAMAEMVNRHGLPIHAESGLPQELLILGMGKLGGRELNVSSDIDLITLYDSDGLSDGRRSLDLQEFYSRCVQIIRRTLTEHELHGIVFRCDLRLRPDGNVGPLAWSLNALEKYFRKQGREWERYAWIKARILPARAFEQSQSMQQAQKLEAIRRPFVYRKYLDFDALAALRDLRERIRQDWEQRAYARSGVDATHNIKLGKGSIRELEFIVQLNQLIRGGRLPSLQHRSFHGALLRQKQAGVIDDETANRLEQAYIFLRQVEHRLQYRNDEQTHLLPRDNQQMEELTHSMAMPPDLFKKTLATHREFVSDTFQTTFRLVDLPQPGTSKNSSSANLSGPTEDPTHVSTPNQPQTHALLQRRRIRQLPESSRQRLKQLLPALEQAAAKTEQEAITLQRLLDLLEHIASRSVYLSLLLEYPQTLERLAKIVNASPWAAQYLMRYPLLLDSLIEWKTLMQAPDYERLRIQLRAELDACRLPNNEPDIEQQMNLMRDLQHQITFQLLAQDLSGQLSVEKLADYLSGLADLLLEETIYRVWPLVQTKKTAHAPLLQPPRFAVIAYGKLGGKELGYASDLDLVFLYDDPSDGASERYTRLGRRMSSWLSTLTSSGRLYEVDLRLRPDGHAGLLAVSVNAFEQYQSQNAWTWEHQAISRARFAAGNTEIGARFEALRRTILMQKRHLPTLKADVNAMRARIRTAHPNPSSEFDIKHDPGGMVDLEFIVQFLVLAYAPTHSVLLDNLGNITLLHLAAQQNLIPDELAQQAAQAYRHYRKYQHALRLQGAERARINPSLLQEERQTVLALWNLVLDA